MVELSQIKLKSFTTKPVLREKSADIVLDKQDSIADFISLGTICLYKSITDSTDTEIKIAKRNLTRRDSGTTAYLSNTILKIEYDSFISTSCKYVEDIANYIAEKEYANNIVLGPQISMVLGICKLGEDTPLGSVESIKAVLDEILPETWDMHDTIAAQEVAYNLISKMFQIAVLPFGF